MGVITGIFQQIAKNIPDQDEAQQLLEDAQTADASHLESQQRKTLAGRMTDTAQASEMLLKGLSDEVQKLSYVLLRSGAEMTLNTHFQGAGNSSRLTVSVRSATQNILNFEAKPHTPGKYYLDIEQTYGAFYSSATVPAENFEEVEQSLIAHLDHAFNVPPEECRDALKKLVLNL